MANTFDTNCTIIADASFYPIVVKRGSFVCAILVPSTSKESFTPQPGARALAFSEIASTSSSFMLITCHSSILYQSTLLSSHEVKAQSMLPSNTISPIEVKRHSRQPSVDYFDDDLLLYCRRDGLVTKRHRDRTVGLIPFCDHKSAQKYMLMKKENQHPRGYHRLKALRLTSGYNKLRDTSRIIIHPELAGHFHLLKPPVARTIHERFEYCIILDTLAMYDSAFPETRKKNIKEVERLRREAWEMGEEDHGSEEVQERFDRLEKGLWEEVGVISRFVPAESDEPPPKRQVFPAE